MKGIHNFGNSAKRKKLLIKEQSAWGGSAEFEMIQVVVTKWYEVKSHFNGISDYDLDEVDCENRVNFLMKWGGLTLPYEISCLQRDWRRSGSGAYSRMGTRTILAAIRVLRVEGGLRSLLSSGEVYEEDDTAGRFWPL